MNVIDKIKSLFQTQSVSRTDAEQDTVDAACKKLKLYQFQTCPYCVKVRLAMKKLNLNIELRDIKLNKDWETELTRQGGKHQTPCLKITKDDGTEQWLYESNDIIKYLEERFTPQP